MPVCTMPDNSTYTCKLNIISSGPHKCPDKQNFA